MLTQHLKSMRLQIPHQLLMRPRLLSRPHHLLFSLLKQTQTLRAQNKRSLRVAKKMCRSVLMRPCRVNVTCCWAHNCYITQKLVAEAEICKDSGNALYKQTEYQQAAVSPPEMLAIFLHAAAIVLPHLYSFVTCDLRTGMVMGLCSLQKVKKYEQFLMPTEQRVTLSYKISKQQPRIAQAQST